MTATTITGHFEGPREAQAAVEALVAAGFPAASISVTGARSAAGSEGRFLGRIVVLIVLWSIPGGIAGAVLGLLLALAGIGPSGTTGAIVQVVSWTIIGHLLAGMWAGYVLLADRTRREIAPDREPAVVVSVICRNKTESNAAKRLLTSS